MIQIGICDGDQLGMRLDAGRGMGVLYAVHPVSLRAAEVQIYRPPLSTGAEF